MDITENRMLQEVLLEFRFRKSIEIAMNAAGDNNFVCYCRGVVGALLHKSDRIPFANPVC